MLGFEFNGVFLYGFALVLLVGIVAFGLVFFYILLPKRRGKVASDDETVSYDPSESDTNPYVLGEEAADFLRATVLYRNEKLVSAFPIVTGDKKDDGMIVLSDVHLRICYFQEYSHDSMNIVDINPNPNDILDLNEIMSFKVEFLVDPTEKKSNTVPYLVFETIEGERYILRPMAANREGFANEVNAAIAKRKSSSIDDGDKWNELYELYTDGIIDAEEWEGAKTKLVNSQKTEVDSVAQEIRSLCKIYSNEEMSQREFELKKWSLLFK